MEPNMTHNELISATCAQPGCRRFYTSDVATILDALAAVTAEQIAAGRGVRLKDIGTLKATYRAPRMARNPKTGAEVSVPATYVPKMVFFKSIKDAAAAVKGGA